MLDIIHTLLDPYDTLLLECDGLTKVHHTLLTQAGIPHKVYQGELLYYPPHTRTPLDDCTRIPLHRWLSVEEAGFEYTIDYRARMWLSSGEARSDVPHGIFDENEYPQVVYLGREIELQPTSPTVLSLLLAQRAGTLILFSYKLADAEDRLQALMQAMPDAEIIEGRFTPYSPYRPAWCRYGAHGLAQTWPGRYTFLWDERDERGKPLNWLGNVNYKHPEKGISLVNEAKGLAAVQLRIALPRSAILICGCNTYKTCHLHTIAQKMAGRIPGLPVQVEYPGRQSAQATQPPLV